jgi:hypothetical protein
MGQLLKQNRLKPLVNVYEKRFHLVPGNGLVIVAVYVHFPKNGQESACLP